jgi:thermosome
MICGETMSEKQPIVILPESYSRTIGKDAQRMNIMAARMVADTIRTSLGPRGMDKMLVDSLGDIVTTNDGVTILKEMEIEHPAAKLMVEVAKTQEEEVGDGTTTAVILAGELLKKAETLLDQKVHPTVIAKGFTLASDKAEEILNRISISVRQDDVETFKKIVRTAMMSKSSAQHPKLVDVIVDAVMQVLDKEDEQLIFDTDNIKIEKKIGASIDQTELIRGIVIDKERVHPNMSRMVRDAKIALLNASIEIEKTEIDAQIRIESPDQMQAFLAQEESMLKSMADKIKNSGADVLFCEKGIDDIAQHFLAKNGIFAVRRVSESDMKKLSRATGATVVTNIEDINENDLGFASIVEERKVAGEAMTFIEGCKNPKAVTIFIRGGTEHVVDEVERSIDDSLGDLRVVLKNNKVVAGGGSPEMEVAKGLRDYAKQLGGREQLAIEAFADSMEIIPKTLAENAGIDPIDILVELKSQHEKGNQWAGVNIMESNVDDMEEHGVIEPLGVKIQAIRSASETATMILRIDDVIAASKLEKGPGQGPPHGMGMPGMM